MIIGIAICAYFFLGASIVGRTGFFDEVVRSHLATVIGLPACALASLGLVILLRTIAGNLEVSFLGNTFKGASGPLIMWIFCFLAMTFAIRYTWSSTYELPAGREIICK